MKQTKFFEDFIPVDDNVKVIGPFLYLKFNGQNSQYVQLYHRDVLVKKVDLSDKIARKILVLDAVNLGAVKKDLAEALGISRQTIHNYLESNRVYGSGGLIAGYNPDSAENLPTQRKKNNGIPSGNKARQLEEIRKQERQARERQLPELPFGDLSENIEPEDRPFNEEHDWKPTRYAGTFPYLIALISQNNWLKLILSFFGANYKIFMVFLLMAAKNIRSIEQLKNVFKREAGLILGVQRIPYKMKVWAWFYNASEKNVSKNLLRSFFRHQILAGIVGVWLWFTDGHLLPYTGKKNVHYAYNTQRQMPVPGRTNMVTCDITGRVVDFEIQEGKGDLRGHLIKLGKKWENEVSVTPVMVFDREGHGAKFFCDMTENNVQFVTWQKHIDSKKLEAIKEDQFNEEFKFNDKVYRVFEGEKTFTHTSENGEERKVTLRLIYVWNVTSKRKTCVLSNALYEKMSTKECAMAILNRWGASENTFKHMADKHPLHYEPGFKFVKSENQEMANPEHKGKKSLLGRIKKSLTKLYKKFSKSKEVYNKDGTVRRNSVHNRLKQEIENKQNEIEQLSQKIKQIPERVDVSKLDDYACFEHICEESKNLFDFVTSSVWNVRKLMTEWLFDIYGNKNEYIDLFYAITSCQGWIKSEKHQVTVRLEPLEQASRRAAQEQFCRKLTELHAMTPQRKLLVIEVGTSPLK